MGTAGDIFVWLLDWLLFVLAQAIFINGIFISAYGKSTKRADGTDSDNEMIFYPIYKYLHRTEKKRRFFARHMLDISTFPKAEGLVIVWDDQQEDKSFRVVGNPVTYPAEKWIKEFYDGKMRYDNVRHRIFFYKEEDEYVFSKYLRKPTFGCIICMASVWGSLTFAIVVSMFFQWTFSSFLLLIADVISLAYMNFIIFKHRG